jgi:hypothetical protein
MHISYNVGVSEGVACTEKDVHLIHRIFMIIKKMTTRIRFREMGLTSYASYAWLSLISSHSVHLYTYTNTHIGGNLTLLFIYTIVNRKS